MIQNREASGRIKTVNGPIFGAPGPFSRSPGRDGDCSLLNHRGIVLSIVAEGSNEGMPQPLLGPHYIGH